LRLASGELLRAPAGDPLDAGEPEHDVDVQRSGVHSGHHPEQLSHGEIADERPGLKHYSDRTGADGGLRRTAEHANSPGIGPREAEQHVDRGRLAGAVRAEQRDHFTGAKREIDAADRLHHVFRRPERLLEAAELDNRRLHAPIVLRRAAAR
jgi:hypothetical protein